MSHLFGTDGVRGIPGRYPLVAGVVPRLARTAARLLMRQSRNGARPLILMGRDTRGSGPDLCRWLVRGFSAAGCRTLDLGVAPTPTVAYLAPRVGALAGVVVSASHNPARFNGIKFFTQDGYKMTPELEESVERSLADGSADQACRFRRAPRPETDSGLMARYLDFLRSTFPATMDLSGLRLVVDCAHGAAARIAPALFAGLGAEVVPVGCAPNGRNINDGCGALFPARMQAAVRRFRAHCGVSFDGDADRAIFADEAGRLLDGDNLICLSALHLRRNGLLRSGKVVLTVMSNYGLIRFLERQGISVVSVPVGDRNVTEAIEAEDLSLGGESSGHIIFRSFASTGDGILTALQTLAALRESGQRLSVWRAMFRPMPQILMNISVAQKVPLERLPRLREFMRRCESELRGEGRVFVRYSGTEPLLRIMIEGPERSRIDQMARQLAAIYLDETGQQERSP
ncbi:MAG TPA: phosphoglucosamine mutase [Elusimicrobia bacterium]|nr:phosphoglucosamine mutase [Elusimicrobiota bacterium]HBT60992.1 phosphoglucosamine mutase [Elusimicrobiota bacterium]